MEIPTWQGLARIGRSKAISLTMLVPVIGYLIVFNEHVFQLLELSKEIFPVDAARNGDSTNIWFSNIIRLVFLYFGLMFLGIATILYQCFCPPLIKEYANERGYIREEINLMTTKRINAILSDLSREIPKNHDKFEEFERISIAIEKYHKDPDGYLEGTRDRLHTDLMLMQWENENSTHTSPRSSITLLYTVGFVILTIPSVEMLLRVISVLINNT